MKILKNLYKIKEILFLKRLADKLDCEIYLVGGAVRDIVRVGAQYIEPLRDFDFAVKGDIDLLCRRFAKHFGYKLFYLDKKRKIIRIVGNAYMRSLQKIYFDFTLFEGTIEEDLARRDFTINSIAYDLSVRARCNVPLIDPLGGMKDFKKKIIKANAEKNIIRDPIRILRMFRFAEQFGFEIEKKTLFYAKKYKHLLKWTHPERITEEFFKILKLSDDFKIINYLIKIGVIGELLNVGTGRDLSLRININATITKLSRVFKKYKFNLSKYLNTTLAADRTRLDLIKFMLVIVGTGRDLSLRDINVRLSNKETKYIENLTNICRTFGASPPNFDKFLFDKITSLFRQTNFDNKEIFHNQPRKKSQIFEKKFSNKFYEFYKRAKHVFIDIVFLLDLINIKVDEKVIAKYFLFIKNERKADKLINGEIIKKRFKLSEGRQIGRILNYCRKKIITGEIKNNKELKIKDLVL